MEDHIHIHEIILQDVACFSGTQTMKLSPRINILAGKNNSGKSTILKTIKTLQSGNSSTNTKGMARFAAKDPLAVIKFRNSKSKLTKHFNARSLDVSNYTEDIAIYFNREQPTNRLIEKNPDPKFNPKTHDNRSNFPAQEPDNLLIYFLSKRKTSSFDTQVNSQNAENVFDNLRNLPAKVSKIRGKSSYILIPYIDYCRKIIGMEIGTFPSAQGMELGYNFGASGHISIESMGEGTANLLGLITDLCLSEDKIFLIEELENDLHPEALKALIDLIIEKSETNQFIITTHSNIVLRQLGSVETARTISIEMNLVNKIPTSTINDITENPSAKLALLKKLGYDIADFGFYNGYLILEESTAESIINQLLIPWFAPKLAGRLKTIAANGVTDVEPKVTDFHRLFVYTHTSEVYTDRAWVRLDGDAAGQEIKNALLKKFTKANPSNIGCFDKENFELYYPDQFQNEAVKVLAMPHGLEKQNAKWDLCRKVLDWALSNPEESKAALTKSAHGVIRNLTEIESIIMKQ